MAHRSRRLAAPIQRHVLHGLLEQPERWQVLGRRVQHHIACARVLPANRGPQPLALRIDPHLGASYAPSSWRRAFWKISMNESNVTTR